MTGLPFFRFGEMKMNLHKLIMNKPTLPRNHKMVLIGLAHFYEETGGRTDPPLGRLSEITGYEISWLRIHLKTLAKQGFISTERSRNVEGRRANHHTITLPEVTDQAA